MRVVLGEMFGREGLFERRNFVFGGEVGIFLRENIWGNVLRGTCPGKLSGEFLFGMNLSGV